MKLFSFVVTPYLISGRNLNRVIRLHAYQNIEYHRYHYDIIFLLALRSGGEGHLLSQQNSQNFDLGNKYAYFIYKGKHFSIYQFKYEKIFVQFFGTA